MSTQQMIDAIRKDDRLGHKALQEIADTLETLQGEIAAIKSGKTATPYPSLGMLWTACPSCKRHFMLGNLPEHGGNVDV